MLPGFVGVAPEADGAGEDDLSGRQVGDADGQVADQRADLVDPPDQNAIRVD